MDIVEIRSKKESSIRSQPTTAAPLLYTLKTAWALAQLAPQSEEVIAGGFHWRAVRVGAFSGYIAMTENVEVRPLVMPAPEPPSEEILCVSWDGYEVCGTKAQLAWGRELVDGLMLTILAQFDAPTPL